MENNHFNRIDTEWVSIYGSNSEKDPFTGIHVYDNNDDVKAALKDLFDYFDVQPKSTINGAGHITYVLNGIPAEVFIDHAIDYIRF